MSTDITSIVTHYEKCLQKFGPTARGMDWPNPNDLNKRFKIMIELIRTQNVSVSLLDLGCGAGLMVDYLLTNHLLENVKYHGLDISRKMTNAATKRHPDFTFKQQDILSSPLPDRSYDYIIMNGVLTEKINLSYDEMVCHAHQLICSAFQATTHGLAFNVMSSHVDWTRDDLFHWPIDDALAFLTKYCSRHISIRMDYGLYEYTIYIYRESLRL